VAEDGPAAGEAVASADLAVEDLVGEERVDPGRA
jgi:hypothetical protein